MQYGYKEMRLKIYKNLDNSYYKFSLKYIKNNILSISPPLYSNLGGTLYISMCVFLSNVVILEFTYFNNTDIS